MANHPEVVLRESVSEDMLIEGALPDGEMLEKDIHEFTQSRLCVYWIWHMRLSIRRCLVE
jgi:hypothetical protein